MTKLKTLKMQLEESMVENSITLEKMDTKKILGYLDRKKVTEIVKAANLESFCHNLKSNEVPPRLSILINNFVFYIFEEGNDIPIPFLVYDAGTVYSEALKQKEGQDHLITQLDIAVQQIDSVLNAQ